MRSMFGPNGQQVLALLACIPEMSADQMDQVTTAWRRGSPRDRDRAQLSRTVGEDERYGVLAAASLARREALDLARRVRRSDWAFWAAACDAGAALAAGVRIGRHYETLVAPFEALSSASQMEPSASSLSPQSTQTR